MMGTTECGRGFLIAPFQKRFDEKAELIRSRLFSASEHTRLQAPRTSDSK